MPADLSKTEAIRRLNCFFAGHTGKGAVSYYEVEGFLFAVCSAPELIRPSEWLPLVWGDEEPDFASKGQAEQILMALMRLYNAINDDILEGRAFATRTAPEAGKPVENFADDAPLAQWSRGFSLGHSWLMDCWSEYLEVIEHVDVETAEEHALCVLALTFFSSRKLAEAYCRDTFDKPLEVDAFAADVLEMFDASMQSYAGLGRTISQLDLDGEPLEATPKVGRNDPCPCGSGKKYKKCCGA